MQPLPTGIHFTKGPGRYKYTAHLPNNRGKVHFGHKQYQHYRDAVPKRLGGKIWSHKDHNDSRRRKNYRKRHSAILTKSGKPAYQVKYSPSWFSYHFLW